MKLFVAQFGFCSFAYLTLPKTTKSEIRVVSAYDPQVCQPVSMRVSRCQQPAILPRTIFDLLKSASHCFSASPAFCQDF